MNDELIKSVQKKAEILISELTQAISLAKEVENKLDTVNTKEADISKREHELEATTTQAWKEINKEKEVDRDRKSTLDAREKAIGLKEEKLRRLLETV